MFCSYCGSKLKNETACPNCGAPVTKANYTESNANPIENMFNSVFEKGHKSKVLVVILAIFFGGWGIHNFYLGFNKRAITQILLTTVGSLFIIGPFISSIWGFVEGILYMIGSKNTDSEGKALR